MGNEIGVVGLGTMGRALTLNLLNHGFKVAAFNRTYEVIERLPIENNHKFQGYKLIEDLVLSLDKPRKIILMLPAGKLIDQFIYYLLDCMEEGDILMDGGNSYFKDTMERYVRVTQKGINYFGIGISGGEKGALLGPSIMPGGNKEVYEIIKPYLESIAAKKNNEPCCTYIGKNGSGHYVKMVHNGIEYADMQLIAEIYLILKNVLNMSNLEMSEVFENWNSTEVKSYLVEITAKILKEKDPLSDNDLIDMIVDKSSQKGTGKWTTQEAVDKDDNISLIQNAVLSRITSNLNEERKAYSGLNSTKDNALTQTLSVDELKNAYYIGKIVAYAQGFAQIKKASDFYDWNLNLEKIASIFRAGCIIQAEILEELMIIFKRNPNLKNLLLDDEVIKTVSNNLIALNKVTVGALTKELPIPVLSAALTYIYQLKSPCVGANLIQAQRDFFGAHTFTRIDKEGKIHHEWEK